MQIANDFLANLFLNHLWELKPDVNTKKSVCETLVLILILIGEINTVNLRLFLSSSACYRRFCVQMKSQPKKTYPLSATHTRQDLSKKICNHQKSIMKYEFGKCNLSITRAK